MAIKLDVKQVLTRSTTSVSRSRMLTRDLFAVANLVIDRRKTAEVLTSAPTTFRRITVSSERTVRKLPTFWTAMSVVSSNN